MHPWFWAPRTRHQACAIERRAYDATWSHSSEETGCSVNDWTREEGNKWAKASDWRLAAARAPCYQKGTVSGPWSVTEDSPLSCPGCLPGSHHICWWTSGRCWQRQGCCRRRSVWGLEPPPICLTPGKGMKGTVWVNVGVLGNWIVKDF